jgi:glycosyltransferase involved in cell wall biosynthesis
MSFEASVIIPTFEEWPILQNCLDCLAQQSVALDRFEVIVANNNSAADVPSDLRLPQNARVIHATTPGSYAARNTALREAQGAVLFFTDSDCLPDRCWIENGLAALAGLGPTGRIAGAIEMFPAGPTWTGPELFDRTVSLTQKRYATRGWCATANLVTHRSAFDLIGPFSEDWFSGGDAEWGLRATGKGSRIVYDPTVLIRHPARQDFQAIAKKIRRKAGATHQIEQAGGTKKRWAVGYLMPKVSTLQKIVLDTRLSSDERLLVLWIQCRMNFVLFLEILRLRYLSGTPNRS